MAVVVAGDLEQKNGMSQDVPDEASVDVDGVFAVGYPQVEDENSFEGCRRKKASGRTSGRYHG